MYACQLLCSLLSLLLPLFCQSKWLPHLVTCTIVELYRKESIQSSSNPDCASESCDSEGKVECPYGNWTRVSNLRTTFIPSHS